MEQPQKTNVEIYNTISKEDQFLIFVHQNERNKKALSSLSKQNQERGKSLLQVQRLSTSLSDCKRPGSPCALAFNLGLLPEIRMGIPPMPSSVLMTSRAHFESRDWVDFVKKALVYSVKFIAKQRSQVAGPHFDFSLLEGPLFRMLEERSGDAYEQFLEEASQKKVLQSSEVIAWAKKILGHAFEETDEILEAFLIHNGGVISPYQEKLGLEDDASEKATPYSYRISNEDKKLKAADGKEDAYSKEVSKGKNLSLKSQQEREGDEFDGSKSDLKNQKSDHNKGGQK